MRRPIATGIVIGAANDRLERNADHRADQALAQSNTAVDRGAKRPIQVSARRNVSLPTTSNVSHVVASAGAPLEPATRRDMEQRFGEDFSDVRIHADADAARSAAELNARAYTVGNHIIFGERGSPSDRRLLAHELAHVAQSSQSPAEASVIRRKIENYPAGGCATCVSAANAGTLAHGEVQDLFGAAYRDVLPEQPYYADPDNGRLDLIRIEKMGKRPRIIEIGEIKPDNDQGRRDGARDLRGYHEALTKQLNANEFLVSRLDDPAPSQTVAFKDNPASSCPTQTLSVRGPKIGGTPGLYLYKCTPPGRKSRAKPPSCCRKKDEKEPDKPPTIFDWQKQGKPDTADKDLDKGDRKNGRSNGDSRQRDRRPYGPRPGREIRPEVIAALVIIAGILSVTPWGRVGAILGTAIGTLLRVLGITLGLGVATAGAEEIIVDDDAPGPETADVPPRRVPVPGEPRASSEPPKPAEAAGPSVSSPPAKAVGPAQPGTSPKIEKKSAPQIAPPAKRHELTAKKSGRSKAKSTPRKMIRWRVIEGIRIDQVVTGRPYLLANKERFFLIRATSMQPGPGPGEHTATFVSLAEWDRKSLHRLPAGNVYIATHPYRVPAEEVRAFSDAPPEILDRLEEFNPSKRR